MKLQPTPKITNIGLQYSGKNYSVLKRLFFHPKREEGTLRLPQNTDLKFKISGFPEELYRQMDITHLYIKGTEIRDLDFELIPANLGTRKETWELRVGFPSHAYRFPIDLQAKTITCRSEQLISASNIIDLINEIKENLGLTILPNPQ